MSLLVVLAGLTAMPGCAPRAQTTPAPPADRGQAATPAARSNIPEPARSPTGSPTAPLSATDPCATRLHDLCGPLLQYYALNRRLPDRIEELQAIAGPDPAASFDCPVSGRAYVYVPGGFAWGDRPGFVVLHDAEPSHSGFRWAVVVDAPQGSQPLVTRVVAVPDPVFLSPERMAEERPAQD